MKCDNIFCFHYDEEDYEGLNCSWHSKEQVEECPTRLKYDDYVFSQANTEMVEGVNEMSKRLRHEGTTTDSLKGLFQKEIFQEETGNIEQFNKVLKERLSKIEKVLANKAEEYAKGANRYHNFESASLFLETSREEALLGMMIKHWVSVRDLIKQASTNPSSLKKEIVDEKIGDSINYLILLEGMLLERIDKGK